MGTRCHGGPWGLWVCPMAAYTFGRGEGKGKGRISSTNSPPPVHFGARGRAGISTKQHTTGANSCACTIPLTDSWSPMMPQDTESIKRVPRIAQPEKHTCTRRHAGTRTVQPYFGAASLCGLQRTALSPNAYPPRMFRVDGKKQLLEVRVTP